jgi:hypothetical protein
VERKDTNIWYPCLGAMREQSVANVCWIRTICRTRIRIELRSALLLGRLDDTLLLPCLFPFLLFDIAGRLSWDRHRCNNIVLSGCLTNASAFTSTILPITSFNHDSGDECFCFHLHHIAIQIANYSPRFISHSASQLAAESLTEPLLQPGSLQCYAM